VSLHSAEISRRGIIPVVYCALLGDPELFLAFRGFSNSPRNLPTA
jgi:hypothetical protein